MKKVVLSLLLSSMCALFVSAQETIFSEEIEIPEGYVIDDLLMPPSPLSLQVLFVGGVDLVQTTPTYGYEAGVAYAKEWHDFIGFTPDETGESLGWVSVNHEMIYQDNRIGDGGGMTVFRVERDQVSGQLEVVEQELEDGRKGEFFNVDFVNTVGETGMNCGGISSIVDGRIWTAEEWFRSNNGSIYNGGFSSPTSSGGYPKSPGGSENQGVRDTSTYLVSSDIEGFDGLEVPKYENFNWMVEIDPRQAKAVRKQYNWGRQGFEGGVVAADNQTVYLGVDATPAFWAKFVADEPGDFTKGKTYIYKHDAPEKWLEVDNTDPEKMLNFADQAVELGGTMYNRVEWVAIDATSGKIYWTETGRDRPGSRWADENAAGAVHDPYHINRAVEKGIDSPNSSEYPDYYGRVWVYDPAIDSNYVFLEGGPDWDEETSPSEADYFTKHLSNPDGLNVMMIDGQPFLVICEDLNGTSYGRMPAGISNRTCELWLLDLSIEQPTVDDLIRITAVPRGAEITGAMPTPDGKSLLVNSQHPNSNNPFPFNHSLTFAIHGFDEVTVTSLEEPQFESTSQLQIFPNPTTRTVYLSEMTDLAVYNAEGQRLKVFRNTNQIDVSNLPAGMYFLQTAEGETKKLIVK
jgi:secreted PhoX family phosphatase